MNTTKSQLSTFIVFGIPVSIIVLLVVITKLPIFQVYPEKLSTAITIDLLITVPVIYFLLIRKKKISNYSVVSFFVLGIILLSFILPKENQQLLSFVKTWLLPLVEIGIFSFIFYKVRKNIKKYRSIATGNSDFFETVKTTIEEDFPKKIATILAMEIGVFYYGFIHWKKRILKSNEFSYHNNSGTVSLLVTLIFIIGIETYVLHILLMKWSSFAAWLVSALSIYSGIQIFGFLKSITKRPILVTNDMIHLRYGILSETTIDLEDIKSVEITSVAVDFDTTTRKLSPLGELESHNMMIHLQKEQTLYGLYGTTKKFTSLALYADDPKKFKALIDDRIIVATDPKNPLSAD